MTVNAAANGCTETASVSPGAPPAAAGSSGAFFATPGSDREFTEKGFAACASRKP
jgi:hypothetical protein